MSPGTIGVTLAHALNMSGHQTFYASEGRTKMTQVRAKDFGVRDLQTVENVFAECDVVFCIVRNDNAAYELANKAVECGYKGLYVDANSFSHVSSDMEIERICKAGNVKYVEMSILAWPIYDVKPETGFERQIHISGDYASKVESLFSFDFWHVFTHEKGAKEFRRDLVFVKGVR